MNTAQIPEKQVSTPIVFKTTFIVTLLLLPFIIYFGTAYSLVEIWNSSETFAHGYIILPITLWLIWRKRSDLNSTLVQPFWPGLALMLLDGIGWILADIGDVQVIRQYSFVAFFPLLVLTVFGVKIFQIIIFPLFFLMFAVPFGDVLLQPLINFTADFTVAALQITGIPVLRNGSTFFIPSGTWSVVDACSGLRYLISSVTLGCLYAYLSYSHWKKRVIFVIAATIMPILANGLRAYMIVMIGHLSSMRLAVGVDHLIYGWLFFGLVIYVLFWIGNFWRDMPLELTSEGKKQTSIPLPFSFKTKWVHAAGSVILLLSIFPLIERTIDQSNYNANVPGFDSFISSWTTIPAFIAWQPQYLPAVAEFDRSFAKDNLRVKLVIKYYRNQKHGSELISSANTMTEDNAAHWLKTVQSDRLEPVSEATNDQIITLPFHETQLTNNSQQLMIWSTNWINGQFSSSQIKGKIIQTRGKLALQGDDGAAIILAVPFTDSPEQARQTIREFLKADFMQIQASLNQNRKQK
ncbi:exosortase A [Undibacterium sp. SXout20W]|uniref:exosortase A n=1 Tax=Undibacterium sp. SXout20W TaxID=3413051 RepID=UPI003BEF6B3D